MHLLYRVFSKGTYLSFGAKPKKAANTLENFRRGRMKSSDSTIRWIPVATGK